MQLLHSSGLSATQFASLSLLLKPSVNSNGDHGVEEKDDIDMVAPLVIASPVAVASPTQTLDSLKDLHIYLTDVLNASTIQSSDNSVSRSLLREDEKMIVESAIQTFRPIRLAGLGLYYRLLRITTDNALVMKLASLILSSDKSSPIPTKIDPSVGLFGVVICVGMSGAPYAHCAYSPQYTTAQRINDVLSFLSNPCVTEPGSAKALLHTYLISDDEMRKNNEMMNAPDLLIVPEPNDSDTTGVRNLLSPRGMISPIADIGRKTRRVSMQAIRGNAGGNSGSGDAPAAEIGFTLSIEPRSVEAARILSEKLRVLSIAENDSKLRRYETSGSERKSNLDLIGGAKSRFRRTRKGEIRDADFDNFDYKGPTKETTNSKGAAATVKAVPALSPAPEGPNKLTIKSSRKDTTTRRAVLSHNRRSSSESGLVDDDSSYQQSSRAANNESSHFDPFNDSQPSGKGQRNSGASRSNLDYDHSNPARPPDTSSIASQARVTVNIALNEDLTCAYKLSQLSSCNVEGFVQVSINAFPIDAYILS